MLARIRRLRSWWTHRFVLAVKWADQPSFTHLSPPMFRSWADPFFVRRDGRVQLFFEEYDHARDKGRIVTCAIDRGGSGAVCVALERPYHLSYPFLIERGGDLFMVPESYDARAIDLFRCTSFPSGWVHHRRLLDGIDAADSTLLQRGGRWWLFTSVGLPQDNLHLQIHHAGDLDDAWIPHPINRERRYAWSAHDTGRSAGPLFERGGDLFRPAQLNPDFYGQSIALHRIDRLSETEFAETAVAAVGAPFGAGTHHAAFDGELLAIDVRERGPRGNTPPSLPSLNIAALLAGQKPASAALR